MIDKRLKNKLDQLRRHETENTAKFLSAVVKDNYIDWEILGKYIHKYDKIINTINNILTNKNANDKMIQAKQTVNEAILTSIKHAINEHPINDDSFGIRIKDIKAYILDNGLCDLEDFGGTNIESKIGIALNDMGFIGKVRDFKGTIRMIDKDIFNKLCEIILIE